MHLLGSPSRRTSAAPRMGIQDQFSDWYQQNSPNVPPNMGGERVVSKPKSPSLKKAAAAAAADSSSADGGIRRALIFGVLLQPIFYGAAQLNIAGKQAPSYVDVDADFDDGSDAVTSPALETELVEAMSLGGVGPNGRSAASMVDELEDRGGSQIAAAGMQGRWVLPWVGGWQRVYTTSDDPRFLGGPRTTEFSAGGSTYKQVSCRHFVYGPGDGGLTTEYLHASAATPGAPKRLLTRQGGVTNLGTNLFEIDYPRGLAEFEVTSDEKTGNDKLRTGQPLEGGAERETATAAIQLRTTYLSEQLWIVRGVKDPSQCAAFVRTETRSVIDRRGLVAEGQIAGEKVDEKTRYGGLLFGETIQEYAGWDEKQAKDKALNDKLFR